MIRPFLLSGLLLLAGVSAARAQGETILGAPVSSTESTPSIDDIRKTYRIHAGPFYVNPTLQLKELGVDTNVFNQADTPKSDFTFTITPQADLAVPMARRALLRTVVGLDAVYYQKYSSERSLDPQADVRGELYATRLTFFAEDSYLNTRQRPNYEVDVRSRHLDNDATAGVNVAMTPRSSVEVAVESDKTRYDGDVVFLGQSLHETLDRDSQGYSVTARHKLTPLTTIAARYENLQDTFPYSPERNNDSYRIMPGIEFKPRALINGSAYVGYRSFHGKDPALPDYSGPVAQVALSYTLLGSTMFGVTAMRDIEYSYEVATPYFLDNGVGVFVRRQLGGRFDAIVNAERHRYDYRALLGAGVGATARFDTTDNLGANIGYRMKRRTRAGFGVSYWKRTSTTQDFRDFNGLRMGMTVTYGF